jgi:hypothetical protein
MYGSMKKPEMGGPMPKFKVPAMKKPVVDPMADPKMKAIQKRLGK